MDTAQNKGRSSTRKLRDSVIVKTTIYDVMETVIDVVDSDEINLINEVTRNLLSKAKPYVLVSGSANF